MSTESITSTLHAGWERLYLLWIEDVYNPFILERTPSADDIRTKLLADSLSAVSLAIVTVLVAGFVFVSVFSNKEENLKIKNNKVSLRFLIRALLLVLVLGFNTQYYVYEVISTLWNISEQVSAASYYRSVAMLVFIVSCIVFPGDVIKFKQRLTTSANNRTTREGLFNDTLNVSQSDDSKRGGGYPGVAGAT